MDKIEYNILQICKLVGCKIIGAISGSPDQEMLEDMYGFMVERPDGSLKKVWVLQDEGGNGPGYLNIED